MLSDPILGPDIMAGMNRARQTAAACADGKQKEGLQDWYHGLVFLAAVRAGLFTKDTDTALSISTDGFEAWRQGGFQGWPIIVTVLNLPPGTRTRNVCEIVVAITPGPRQPVDLESFLHPLAEELNELARGIPGVRVAGTSEPVVLRAHPVQFTTDMSAGDKLLNTTGSGGYSPTGVVNFTGCTTRPATTTTFLRWTLLVPMERCCLLFAIVLSREGRPRASPVTLLRWRRLG